MTESNKVGQIILMTSFSIEYFYVLWLTLRKGVLVYDTPWGRGILVFMVNREEEWDRDIRAGKGQGKIFTFEAVSEAFISGYCFLVPTLAKLHSIPCVKFVYAQVSNDNCPALKNSLFFGNKL